MRVHQIPARLTLFIAACLFAILIGFVGAEPEIAQAQSSPQNFTPITIANADKLTSIATLGSADHLISNISIAFSPDSHYLAYNNDPLAAETGVGLWDLQAGQDVGIVNRGVMGTEWLGFTPAGVLIALAQASPTIDPWNPATGTTLPEVSLKGVPFMNNYESTALSPDATLAVGAASDTSLIVGDTSTGEQKYALTIGATFKSPAISPDNTLLALADANGPVQVWDLAAGKMLFSQPSKGGYNLAFTPDNQTLALCDANNGIEMWDAHSGKPLTGIPDAGCSTIAFSPDGTMLATSDFQNVTLYDVAKATKIASYPGHAFAFSKDGHYFAAITNDETQLTIYAAAAGSSTSGNTSAPTATSAPAEAGTTAATPAPTEASAQTSATTCSLTAKSSANLRSGPGISFGRAGSIAAGQTVEADGQAQAGGFTWYRLSTGGWVRSDLVTAASECTALSVVSS